MKFTKIWTNTGELNFDSDVSIVDINATHRLSKPVSTATLQPNNRYQNDGRLNFYSNSQNGVLNFGVENVATVQPTIVDAIGASYTSIAKSTVILSSINDFTIRNNVSVEAFANADLICELSAEHTYQSSASEHAFIFDINVDRDNPTQVSSKFENAIGLKNSVYSPFEDNETFISRVKHSVIQASALNREVSSYQSKMLDVDCVIADSITHGLKAQHNISDNNDTLIKIQSNVLFELQESAYLSPLLLSSSYFLPAGLKAILQSDWQKAGAINTSYSAYFENGLPIKCTWLTHFENTINPILFRPDEPITIEPEPGLVQSTLEFKKLWDSTGILDFLSIELDALIIMNEVSVYHIAEDGTKIAVNPINATLSFDIDSQVWSFKGQFVGEGSLAYLGYRSQYEINVNGHNLLFTLREYSRTTSFTSDAYTFTGVTSSQWLFSPYATLYSNAIEEESGAWQIADSILSAEGFSLNRSELTPEWILQADSFSYVNQPAIELITQIAQACGAIIQPDKTQNIIHVQPRYKVSPWNWSNLTDLECDHVINADYVMTESSEDNTTPEINNVLISGETHGVITNAVKSGSAGDVRSTDVVSVLSQDNTANIELARNIMSDSGQQEILGLNIPLLSPESDYGLLLPGEIVRIVYENKTITGLCLSNSIGIQTITDISQSVKLELNNGYS
ncbi:hypothetical protein [Psychromonas sp.]|uniref:hypothetical protein n=1 Tax=Psychromonas sp. TaxID=1884585 RepID=UPI003A977A8A